MLLFTKLQTFIIDYIVHVVKCNESEALLQKLSSFRYEKLSRNILFIVVKMQRIPKAKSLSCRGTDPIIQQSQMADGDNYIQLQSSQSNIF